MKAYQRTIRRIAAELGFTVEEGKKHLRIMDGEELVAVAPRSWTERGRGHKNLVAALRRAAERRS